MASQVLQFKITLEWISPKIWRRIQVPETYTFWDLHCAIQDAMGWAGGHLHGFTVSEAKKGYYEPIRIQMPNPEWGDNDVLDERQEKLTDWFPTRLKQCQYTYDFGDDWEHTVLFEKALPKESGITYPRCTAGKNTCPPEDCGGPGGYADLLTALKRPKSRRGKELREWMGLEEGKVYDPTEFSLKDIQFADPKQCLKELLKWQS